MRSRQEIKQKFEKMYEDSWSNVSTRSKILIILAGLFIPIQPLSWMFYIIVLGQSLEILGLLHIIYGDRSLIDEIPFVATFFSLLLIIYMCNNLWRKGMLM